MELRFGSDKWKVVKRNLVIARGIKHGSLYLVNEPAEGCMVAPVKQNKIWFTKSRAKRVHFANVNFGAKEMLAEHGCDSDGDSTVTKSRWVLKTRSEEFSRVGSLLYVENAGGPWCISGSGEVSILVKIEDESLRELQLTLLVLDD
ncbi:hypothetical protein E3N88_29158 [Mikania micrantha]|uniref:Uncharacterized protein n=1 Tax=Mikania micrantha TaxID=192012 RepID=A0A5N6MI16_9ASTR|nr:hypothetical protein E3N88_29158 [Mikania micrantha]